MASSRLVIGIIVGILLSFLTAYFFNMEEIKTQIGIYLSYDILRVVTLMIGANFQFDMISFFTAPALDVFLGSSLIACLFIGFISGTIAKGAKRGILTGLVIVVVNFLIWMLLSVISGEDLMAFFQGAQLIATIGGVLGALTGAIIGGLLGGLISGPYEEVY